MDKSNLTVPGPSDKSPAIQIPMREDGGITRAHSAIPSPCTSASNTKVMLEDVSKSFPQVGTSDTAATDRPVSPFSSFFSRSPISFLGMFRRPSGGAIGDQLQGTFQVPPSSEQSVATPTTVTAGQPASNKNETKRHLVKNRDINAFAPTTM